MSTSISPRPPTTADARAGRLVAAGALAGPVMVLTWAAQAFTRDGYDITRHPMSLLALGDGGFVQVANFVVTGTLLLALGRGYAHLYRDGVGRTWLARLVTLCGAGMIGAGIFRADAGAGFPAGAPEGMPDVTTMGILHEVGFIVVMVSWTAAMVILFRRARHDGDRSLRNAVAGCFVLVLVVSAVPHLDSYPTRAVLAGATQLAFLAVAASHQRRHQLAR